ncbi:MAG: hypothetical protein IJ783_06440 [Kiritimatiellae bacterium]|nr:hypothetical protein [Kiritimatiellia bacterium]
MTSSIAAVAATAALSGTAFGGVSSYSGATVDRTIVTNKSEVTITSVYTFSDSTAPGSIAFDSATSVDVLVVAGGGGGGAGFGGGGGVYREGFAVSSGTYAVTVGAGGPGGVYSDTTSAGEPGNGGDSSFGSLLVAIGGGGGGAMNRANGGAGGSGVVIVRIHKPIGDKATVICFR